MGKGRRRGELGVARTCGVEEEHAPGGQVLARQRQVFHGKEVGRVRAEMPRRVLDDEVEFAVRMAREPAAPVVDHHLDLGVLQQRRDLGEPGDDLEVPRVDLHDGEPLHVGVMGNHLRPRAGGQPHHQHLARRRVQRGEGIRTDDVVPVVHQIGAERPVVDAAPVDATFSRDGDHAALGLDDGREALLRAISPLPEQPRVDVVKQRGRRQRREPRTGHDDGEGPERAPIAPPRDGEETQRHERPRREEEHRDALDRQPIHEDEPREQAARRGARDVGHVEVRQARSGAVVGRDPEVADQGENGTLQAGGDGHERQRRHRAPGHRDEARHRRDHEETDEARREDEPGQRALRAISLDGAAGGPKPPRSAILAPRARVPRIEGGRAIAAEEAAAQAPERDAQEIRPEERPERGRRPLRHERIGPVPDELVRQRDEAGQRHQHEGDREAHARALHWIASTAAPTRQLTDAASVTEPARPSLPRMTTTARIDAAAAPSVFTK